MTSLSVEQKKQIVDFLHEKLNCDAIFLFGNAAYGALREDSDIDIAYLAETKIGHYDRYMIAQELAMELKRDVDLIDFNEASPVFRVQIIAKHERLSNLQPIRTDYAFMRALKEYALLNEERECILREKGYLGGESVG